MRRLLLCLVLLCGCAGETTTPPPAVDLPGIWILRTVNGAPLPYDLPRTDGRIPGDMYQLYAGTFELSPNLGVFGVRDSVRYTRNGFATTTSMAKTDQ